MGAAVICSIIFITILIIIIIISVQEIRQAGHSIAGGSHERAHMNSNLSICHDSRISQAWKIQTHETQTLDDIARHALQQQNERKKDG
jgi:hypothetical protein